jgi:hypothetical protein
LLPLSDQANDFTIIKGTSFASHKLPLGGYLAVIAVYCNEVKGDRLAQTLPESQNA